MDYTREQAEQVIRDWNTFHLGSSDFRQTDYQFLNHKFPKLPEKGWLVRDDKSAIVFRTGFDSGYGVNISGKWENGGDWSFGENPQHWQPATEEEVITMLTEQAEKMGYVKGVDVMDLYKDWRMTIDSCYDDAWDDRLFEDGELWGVRGDNDGILLMKDGKWAEIIADDLQERFDALVKEAKERGKNVTVKFE
jgi:hypothetical protein